MTTPKRIQRKRTKGWKMPDNTVYVGRPTKWGNPFYVRATSRKRDKWEVRHGEELLASFSKKHEAQQEAIRLFEKWFSIEIAQPETELFEFRTKYGWHGFAMRAAIRVLRGKNLACFCPLDSPCHADVLLKLANQ